VLQAQIDILDEAGRPQESMTILGTGRVSLGKRQTGRYLHADEAEPDLVVIMQDGTRLLIEVKASNALQRDDIFVAEGSFEVEPIHGEFLAFLVFLEATRHRLRVKQVEVSGELLCGNAIIHHVPASSTPASSLIDRAQASAKRGAAEVTEQLRRLRDQGKIDDNGNILVAWPDDMNAGSSTDL
jgi:hypothetical protein